MEKYLFRLHRGSLEESMKTIREITCIEDIKMFTNSDSPITCKWYCHDERIDWDTWIIKQDGFVLGFTNGEVK